MRVRSSQLGKMSAETDGRMARVSAPSVEGSLVMKLLPGVLSVIAGSADIISFFGLNGLFTAHITGNLILIAGAGLGAACFGAVGMWSLALPTSLALLAVATGLTPPKINGTRTS